ncbi:MAG: WbqC family protein [Bacteroidales bacterium]|nr:WbqC family protein [Bacteroidales bacterium]
MQICKKVLLSTTYLPNIQYFSKLLTCQEIYIEVHDNFQKQSYRNRATIYGSNGPLDLVIPVKKPNGNKTKTRDIPIDYDTPWNKIHWKALVSSYKHSPFFEIFEEEIKPLYNKKYKFLLDWNFYFLDNLFAIIGHNIHYQKTENFQSETDGSICDYREIIHPKKRMQKPDPFFSPVTYFQVFAQKHGFKENLSFIDLLFNEGPQAVHICKKSLKNGIT